MSKLDPRLRYLMETKRSIAPETAERLGLEGVDVPFPTVEVLVRLRSDDVSDERVAEILKQAGMEVRAVVAGTYTVASGVIPLDQISELEKIASVRHVEASRPLIPEIDLCVPEVRANILHLATPAIRGTGALIGVIDSGIDFHHPDFRNPDGTSRIRFLWDQGAGSVSGSRVPYGREYTRAKINAAINATASPANIPQVDPLGHGTHVAGIAAGCGRAQATHVGLAPEADLIIVALDSGDATTLGRSVRAFEAFDYIVRKAARTPVAINFSQGMNGGGHSGETALETGLSNLARKPGVAIIKSAGNEQQWRIHAGGTLTEGVTRELRLEVRTNDRNDDIIEIWFDDKDDISVAIKPPGGSATTSVARGESNIFNLQTGNVISISVDTDSEGTGDTVATIIMSRGTASMIQPGNWSLLLQANRVVRGRFDAWIERTGRSGGGVEQMRFAEASHDPTRTISVPGTARNIITVGSYVTRLFEPPDAPIGALSFFSSRGPARYGQLKPEITAPGEVLESAQVGTGGIVRNRGTSMAAPVVTGAVALILSQHPELTCPQLKQILMQSARRTGFAIAAPNNEWGYGKLDVQAALELAGRVKFSVISNVTINGATLSWQTDIPTTGAVRFLPVRRHLLLGKSPQSIAHLELSMQHSITLEGLATGRYFCEIVAFTQENFWTEDDNQGRCYEIQVEGDVAPEQIEALRLFENATASEMVGRNCELQNYDPLEVPSFKMKGPFITYASPDSTFAVTKQLIESARESILIGIYDFTASYMKDLLIRAMRRGVRVALMLDLDGRTGETELFEELGHFGCEVVSAPSCASDNAQYFASSHEKVIVIDGQWVLVQSGNYSENSIPANEEDGRLTDNFLPGNRDMGVAVRSEPLARFFTYLLRRDMELELEATPDSAEQSDMAALEPVELFVEAPEQAPEQLFPSASFEPCEEITVTPIISPENYMSEIPDRLRRARQSIYIEQQYIRSHQPAIASLLAAIREAMAAAPWLDVRIIVAKPFPGNRYDQEAQAIEQIATALNLEMGENVRVLSPRHFIHCHNKLIIVDDQAVLISSQNWSDSAVVKNREAGLWIEYPELARYYSQIFESDWQTALIRVPPAHEPEAFGPESLATGRTVPLNWGDYIEV